MFEWKKGLVIETEIVYVLEIHFRKKYSKEICSLYVNLTKPAETKDNSKNNSAIAHRDITSWVVAEIL